MHDFYLRNEELPADLAGKPVTLFDGSKKRNEKMLHLCTGAGVYE